MTDDRTASLAQVFPGESEMARQMRAKDWASTTLGDPLGWPDALKIPLRMLLTSKFEMWLGWGPDLNFFYNDAYIPTLGAKHPDMLGQPFRTVWREVYADVEDQVERVWRGEATWNNALLLLLERNGYPEETYHSFSYSPLHGADGSVGGLLCVVSEDTERVIADRRLEILRRLGHELVGAADERAIRDAVCRVFRDYRRDFPFVLFLPAGPETAGWACAPDSEALLDRSWPLPDGDGISTVALAAEEAWPSGGWDSPPLEAMVVGAPGVGDSGPAGVFVAGLNPHRRKDPDIAGFGRLVANQIGAALANASALSRERNRADQLWARSRDLMVVVDADGVFRAVNPAWTRILGHEADAVVGRSFDAFMAPEDVADSTRALEQAIRDGDLNNYENRFRTVDGQYRCISWHTTEEGGLVYAYGRDVTDQKAADQALAQAETALRQAQKMEAVGQLTGGIAHDFNNLLTGIIGSLDIVRRRVGEGRLEDLDRFIRAATTSADRAAALTQRLLAFSRRQTLAPTVVDPDQLIEGMMELIERTIGESITCKRLAMGAGWRTSCDANQLESAILNLALNARDAMPGGGLLKIETGRISLPDDDDIQGQRVAAGDYVTLSVSDTGVGMTPEALAQAFEPFFTTKPIGEGTGLGLSMVYGFARQSNGFVRLGSEPGRGTTVTVHLPRTLAALKPAKVPELLESPLTGSGRILVVEDEPAVRMLMVDALRELGYEILEAADGPAGLSILWSDTPLDLIITDVGLPGMNGRQLVDAGRHNRPDLKVLFVTGYAYDKDLGNSRLPQGAEVLPKPFTGGELAARARSLLRMTDTPSRLGAA